MSSVFVIPICAASVTLGIFVYYICCETEYCSTRHKQNYNSDGYMSTPCI